MSNEVTALRQRLSESPASIGLKRSKEAIVRVMYVEMLGQSADFGHIHAVNMTQQTNLLCKRVGYLACSLCLHPEHELITLLVNTMRRDLKSSNHLEVCAALIAVSKLVNNEIMPAVIECIAELLEHTHEVVRKKAVMALHRLHLVQPGCLSSLTDKLRRALCDRDPAVMGASLHILHVLIDESPAAYKDLVPSFVSILKQITEHRLPSSFDYHRMPAPWIQIKLLQVLASLGVADQRASEHQYEVSPQPSALSPRPPPSARAPCLVRLFACRHPLRPLPPLGLARARRQGQRKAARCGAQCAPLPKAGTRH